MNFSPSPSQWERPERRPVVLDHAVVYDLECYPNVWLLNAQGLYTDLDLTFELSEYRDDRRELLAWFQFWSEQNTPMLSFNGLAYDYPVVHQIWTNPSVTYDDLYEYSMSIIEHQHGRFGPTVWESDRLTAQLDLLKIHHLDNPAKRTSLKALQFAMRSENVMECPLPFGIRLTREQIDQYLIPYCKHDVSETKRFAHYSMDAIKFRIGLMDTVQGDVLNYSDSKIGSKILEQRLGDDLCYTRETGTRQPRQTIRDTIPLRDIIFPYVQFRNPEFARVLDYLRGQTLHADEITDRIRTKGVLTGLKATVGGLDFYFGTGGIHGSVESQVVRADEEYAIEDIDVAQLYPNIAIINGLYPEHLDERFTVEYARLPKERKEWQARKGKKCNEANTMKLGSNGVYGNSNNAYSCFLDARFTMSITINGQLMLCMLAESLLIVPGLQLVMINTDGITYRVPHDMRPAARAICAQWEALTKLVLEDVQYSTMWIRDVNNYVAQPVKGDAKLKGAYWYPAVFPDDIGNAQPPAWHKDHSAQICVMAAVAHMTRGVDIERFIYGHADKFDFMSRAKCTRADHLYIGDVEQQRITRYYVTTSGDDMKIVRPPAGPVGTWKRKNGISDFEYHTVLQSLPPGEWSEKIHTKNRSVYEERKTAVEAGYKVRECNRASDFSFEHVNYQYYVDAARKLVVS